MREVPKDVAQRVLSETGYRSARFLLSEMDRAAEDGRIPIAISSETPVERWFGLEVLDHSRDALDMARLDDRGLPMLMDHDPTRQIGRVEDITLGQDRVLRGMVRFSRSPEAQQVREDVLDGIRTDISVGYAIEQLVLEEQNADSGDTYRAARWRPMESSFVAVPADETVGVGRSTDAPVQVTVREKETKVSDSTEKDMVAAERERAQEIGKLARDFKMEDKLHDWIGGGASVQDVQRAILADSQRKAAIAETTKNPDGITLSAKEQRTYSLRHAITQMLAGKRDGFEFEVSDELAKNRQGYQGGLVVPGALSMRTGVVGTSSLGGALKFTEKGDDFIEALRNALLIAQTGARVLNGLNGDVAFTKQLTASTAYWLAEAGTVTNSDLTYGLVTLSPKTLMFSAGVTRQLLAQASDDVEAIIRADFIASQARELDRVFLVGTSTSNEPTGLFNTANVGAVTIGANGGPVTWAKVTELEAKVAAANGIMDDSAAYITNYKVTNDLKNIFKGTAGFLPIYGEGDRQVNGYRVLASNVVPSNLTKGTSTTICSALVFGGSFREVLLGFWNGGGVAELLVDPYSAKKTGIVELTGYTLTDIQFRHAQSFAADKDLTTTL